MDVNTPDIGMKIGNIRPGIRNGNRNRIVTILSLIKQNDTKLLSVKLPVGVWVVYDSGLPYLSRPGPARLDREISGTSPPPIRRRQLFNLIDYLTRLGWAGPGEVPYQPSWVMYVKTVMF